MQASYKADLAAAKLDTSVAAAEGGAERAAALAEAISRLTPDEAGPALGVVIMKSCHRADSAMTLLVLLDRQALEKSVPQWDWRKLDNWFQGTILDEVWSMFGRLSPGDAETVTAKVSLMEELHYVINSDSTKSDDGSLEINGADIALRLLSSSDPGSDRLDVCLSDYPIEQRRSLREILSELDFSETTPGTWRYSLSANVKEVLANGKNLSSHASDSLLAQALGARRAESFIKKLEVLLRAMQMFPAGHPSIAPALGSFIDSLRDFFSSEPQVTVSIAGETLMVNEARTRRKGGTTQEFTRMMLDRKLNSITFSSSIGTDEVALFAGIFNRSPAYIQEHGGLARLLELRGLDTVSVNRFHYELKSGEEDAEHPISLKDAAVEDAIFTELISRLERGESISSMSGTDIGDALKNILTAEEENRGSGRGILARLIAAIDPSILEDGILANPFVQKNMSWGAVRSILFGYLSRLDDPDPDLRHGSLGKLGDLIPVAVDRGKENTVLQISEKVSDAIRRETDPDVLYRAITVIAALEENLLARGMTSLAIEVGRIISELQIMRYPQEIMESARKRALEEAWRMIDSTSAADEIVQRLLSDDRNTSREAGQLALAMPPGNIVACLVGAFHSNDRHQRARAFRILLSFSRRALPALHEKLEEVRRSADTLRDGKTLMLVDSAWFQVRNVIQVLREIHCLESIPILQELCRDSDPRVRRESLLALARISKEDALGIAIHLLADRSLVVSVIALSMVARQAVLTPAFTTRILDAFDNRALRTHIMPALDKLAGQKDVQRFLLDGVTSCGGDAPFGSVDLGLSALRILSEHGGDEELDILQEYQHRVEGAFFRKCSIDRRLLAGLGDAIAQLRLRSGSH
jgi:hypothetical protein